MIHWRQIHIVAEREFRAIVFSRSFLLGLAAMFALLSLLPILVLLMQWRPVPIVLLVDQPGLFEGVPPRRDLRVETISLKGGLDDAASRALNQLERRARVAGVLIVRHASRGSDPHLTWISHTRFDPEPLRSLRALTRAALRQTRAAHFGLDPKLVEQLDQEPAFDERVLLSAGMTRAARPYELILRYIQPVALVLSLFGLISFQSERLLSAVVEEKLKRLLEVLLTRMSVLELLLGKMLGVQYVGTLLFAIVALVVWSAAAATDWLDLFSLTNAALYVACYVLGFALFGALYAAIGAVCSTPKDAENLALPLRISQLFPFVFTAHIAADPDSWLSRLFSFFPLTAPFVLINRAAISPIAPLELALALGVLAAAAAAALFTATRVFTWSTSLRGRP